jgi:hypothetical protein
MHNICIKQQDSINRAEIHFFKYIPSCQFHPKFFVRQRYFTDFDFCGNNSEFSPSATSLLLLVSHLTHYLN